MSGWLQAVLLGIVQGLTEFLPVSSSGHLVLAQLWLGEQFLFVKEAVAFDLVLHVGTLLPVLYFYRRDLAQILAALVRDVPLSRPGSWRQWLSSDEHRWLAMLVVVGTIPTAVMGVLLKDTFESLFHDPTPVCIALIFTGFLLMSTRYLERPNGLKRLSLIMALIIGIAQGFAITPGISRSGTTIAVALLLGVDRDHAARFSFLLSIPAIMGAVVLVAKDGVTLPADGWAALGMGFLSAMIVGYFALWMLVALVRKGGLYRFAYYLWPVAIAGLFYLT
ncbi:MAG: undecaprenyl-diphosphate phosphatase [Myxococcota bacterium]